MAAGTTSNNIKLRSAKFATTSKKSDDFQKLVTEIQIIESIDAPAMRMSIAIDDSTGMINLMRGSEMIEIQLEDGINNKVYTYNMRIYRLGPRLRFQKNDKYVLEAVSNEFLINETTVITKSFKNKKASEIVKDMLKDTLKTSKKDFIEKTKDKIQCVVPNWRPFDFFNWLGLRSVRDENAEQAGFIFWENFKGFHFKSMDKIIKDCKAGTGQDKVFKYTYGEKNTTNSTAADYFGIQTVQYPNAFDSLLAVRNGQWAGAYCTVSLDFAENSKFQSASSPETPYKGKYWNVIEMYAKQTHLGSKKPFLDDDSQIRGLMNSVRRIRYRPNQLHLWDDDKTTTPSQGKYPERSQETSTYVFCRKITFETIKLKIIVPGNLALHAGEAVDVEIPDPLAVKGKVEKDKTYSGRYVIAGVRHQYKGGSAMTTELELVKDSIE